MSLQSLIVLASALLPLIGVANMERGAFGNSIGMYGYPNGATVAYAMYAAVLVGSYALLRLSVQRPFSIPPLGRDEESRFSAFALMVAWLLVVVLLLMLFLFGGWKVWTGHIGKGEFRVNLGRYGAPAYLLVNAVIPMLMAYASMLYRRGRCGIRERVWLSSLSLLTLLVGSTWGFKSTGVTMLIPAMLVLSWGAAFKRTVIICTILAAVTVVFFYAFDSGTTEAAVGPVFLLTRLTTLQGDVSWLLWGDYSHGRTFPPYMQTLLVFVGDTNFSLLTGITRDLADRWADYHFDILVGSLVGLPLSVVKEGHSIVGTPFSDGLVCGGLTGAIVMAGFAGALCGVLCTLTEHALRRGQELESVLLVTYFGTSVITFLRSGAAVQLIHIATVFGLLAALGICIALNHLAQTISRRKALSVCIPPPVGNGSI